MASLYEGTGFKVVKRELTPILDSCELTPAERAEFDYLDWPALDEGRDGASFFRRQGSVHDMSEFISSAPDGFLTKMGWHAFRADSFFSGILIHLVDEDELITALLLA